MDIGIGTKPFVPDHGNCSGDGRGSGDYPGAVTGQVGAVHSAGCGAGVEGESADVEVGSDEENLRDL